MFVVQKINLYFYKNVSTLKKYPIKLLNEIQNILIMNIYIGLMMIYHYILMN